MAELKQAQRVSAEVAAGQVRSGDWVDYGFGLGLAVRTTPGIIKMMGSVGQFSWPGASGTDWWVDPKEELAVVYMSAAPGPTRWHYRQTINALVYQAIVD